MRGSSSELLESTTEVAENSREVLEVLESTTLYSSTRKCYSTEVLEEYYTARALCEEDTVLSGLPPWQWTSWWANTLTLGAEMCDRFGRGMKRAAADAKRSPSPPSRALRRTYSRYEERE